MHIYQRESPITSVETVLDLVRDNTGPLTEPYNLDKGLWVAAPECACRINVTMRCRVPKR
ncbi:MAG: hypothetical protein JRJ77_19425 [Deltaproteobacteria bacterium]|nr:hypothetical protein [Deltaproteobacteria bacterium]